MMNNQQLLDLLRLGIKEWTCKVTLGQDIFIEATSRGLCRWAICHTNGRKLGFIIPFLKQFKPETDHSYLFWFPLTKEGDEARLLLLKTALDHYTLNPIEDE